MKVLNLLTILIVLLNVLIIINGDESICTTCLEKGQKCMKKDEQYSYYDDIGRCTGDLVCGALNKGDKEEDYVCREFSNEGEQCFSDGGEGTVCTVGLICLDGTCQNIHFAANGEACTKDTDCSGDLLTCTNSICSLPNGVCHEDEDCKFNQVCNITTTGANNKDYGVCIDALKEGALCYNNNKYICEDSLECVPNPGSQGYGGNGTCTKKPSNLKLGEKCDDTMSCDYSNGLICIDDICQKFVEPNIKGNCTNKECGELFACSCSAGVCYQVTAGPSEWVDYIDPFTNCVNENKCIFTDNMYSKDSCVSKKCGSEFCNYLKKSVLDSEYSCSNVLPKQYCAINSSNTLNHINILILSIIILILNLLI